MNESVAPDQFARAVRLLLPGYQVRRAWRLAGGVSADVHALELVEPNGQPKTVVVRQIGATTWKPTHEQAAAMEHGLLNHLYRIGFPVPQPLLLDATRQLLPRPFLISAFVEGTTEIADHNADACVATMADTLARLHALPTDDLPTLPSRLDPLPELFDYLTELPSRPQLRAYLDGWTDSAYRGAPSLLHGDYWPGNLLWQGERLMAVLDWEDAALGDPLSDVAACQLELSYNYDVGIVARFTQAYDRIRPLDPRRLALWTLYVASAASHFMGAWGLEPAREAHMRARAVDAINQAARTLLEG